MSWMAWKMLDSCLMVAMLPLLVVNIVLNARARQAMKREGSAAKAWPETRFWKTLRRFVMVLFLASFGWAIFWDYRLSRDLPTTPDAGAGRTHELHVGHALHYATEQEYSRSKSSEATLWASGIVVLAYNAARELSKKRKSPQSGELNVNKN